MSQETLDLINDEEAFALPTPSSDGPSWLTIAIASVATGIIIWATWSGALFGGS